MRILIWSTVIAFAVIGVSLMYPRVSCGPVSSKVTGAKNDVSQLAAALLAYKSEFGRMPSGDTSQIIKALNGNNPNGIVFIEITPKQLDKSGYVLDPWGYPLQIDFKSADRPHVWSFGKNHINDGGKESSDDITSWE